MFRQNMNVCEHFPLSKERARVLVISNTWHQSLTADVFILVIIAG